MRYALFNQPAVTIYDQPQTVGRDQEGRRFFPIGDQGLYGQSCQVLAEDSDELLAPVRTFYGYPGYVRRFELNVVTEKELRAYLAAPAVMAARSADLLDSPRVDGLFLQTIHLQSIQYAIQ